MFAHRSRGSSACKPAARAVTSRCVKLERSSIKSNTQVELRCRDIVSPKKIHGFIHLRKIRVSPHMVSNRIISVPNSVEASTISVSAIYASFIHLLIAYVDELAVFMTNKQWTNSWHWRSPHVQWMRDRNAADTSSLSGWWKTPHSPRLCWALASALWEIA